MAAPKPLKYLSGQSVGQEVETDSPAIPQNPSDLAAAIIQLQNTLNEVISRYNQLCTDTSHAGDAVTGAGAAATNLFTTS